MKNKATLHTAKHFSHNKEKQADKSIDNNHSHGSSHKSQKANTRENTQGDIWGSKSCGSLGNIRRSKADNNGKSAIDANSTQKFNLSNYSKDNYFRFGKVTYKGNECPDPILKN